MIRQQTNNKNTLVTIVNWALYQSTDSDFDNASTTVRQQFDNSSTGTRQEIDNNSTQTRMKECKKKEKEYISVFVKPDIEEVKSYCKERGNNVDADKWFNFYQSKGWLIGKNKMKDWKAAVRTWEKKPEGTNYRDLSNYKVGD